ncbi:MAG: VCBS repeat-containing protein [Myxococcota bacterium]|nr:VCBS repeat-containing protein [Myxococcota bacterium]
MFLYFLVGCNAEKATQDTFIEEPIIEEEDTGEEPPVVSNDCDPPLALMPQDSVVAPYAPILFFGSGGSGAYRYQLEGEPDSASISVVDGLFSAGSESGEYRVTVTDLECEGQAQANVSVTQGLSVLPASASVRPHTQITMDILGSSGDVTCSMVSNESGGAVDECIYMSGDSEGVDVLRIEDNLTEEAVSIAYIVKNDIELDLWGTRYVLPPGESIELTALNGSGFFDVSGYDETVIQFEDTKLKAMVPGETQAIIQDRYTGMSQDVVVEVSPLRSALGESIVVKSNHDVNVYTVLSDKDLNGDGLNDVVLGFPEHHYADQESGFVAIHLGTETGIENTALQVLSENYAYDLQDHDLFGHSIVTEDFDQDGFVDMAVGARFADRVYLYYNTGNSQAPYADSPDLFLSAGLQEGSGDQFGYSMTHCDVNGDGWNDIIAGAPAHTAELIVASGLVSYPSSGAIRVYLGGESGFDATSYLERVGREQDENGDWQVTKDLEIGTLLAGGDFNGDGYCDILTNTNTESTLIENHKNYVQIYLGNEDGLSEFPNAVISHFKPDTGKEWIAGIQVGDLDDDGEEELFLTWRTSNNSQDLEHQVSIAMFKNMGLETESTRFMDWSENQWSLFSNEVYDIGHHMDLSDVDGDGQRDFTFSSWVSSRPTIFAISGSDILGDTYPGYCTSCFFSWEDSDKEAYIWTYRFEDQGRVSGLAVTEDQDGDGYRDVILVRDQDSTTGVEKEHPYYVGSSQFHTALAYEGVAAGFLQGLSSGFLDVNGDGKEELLIAAPGQQETGSNWGEVLSFTQEDGVYSDGFDLLPIEASDLGMNQNIIKKQINLALHMSTESDFDGDGYRDLAFVSSISWGGSLAIYRSDQDGLEPSPYCVVSIPRFSRLSYLYQGELLGGWDLNQDGFDDYVLGSRFFNNEHGGIYVLYGNNTQECTFDLSFQGWSHGGRLGAELSMGYIDHDICPDLILSEPNLTTDKTATGAIHILWGEGESCRPQRSFSSFYYPLELNNIGRSIASGIDLNEDGYDDIVYTQGRDGEEKTFILDGMALSQAPTTEFVGETPEGPFYPEPWYFYDWLSDYLMGDILHQGDARLELTEDAAGTKWLALGKHAEDKVEMYRFREETNAFETIPYLSIGADSNITSWKGEFGRRIQFHNGTVLIGAPKSDLLGPNIGGVQLFSLME